MSCWHILAIVGLGVMVFLSANAHKDTESAIFLTGEMICVCISTPKEKS